MFRTLTLIAAIGLFVVAPARTATPFRAGGSPDSKKPAPDTPQKIIEELRLNFDRVGSDFEKQQPGAETRKAQQRILDGIDKLLEQDEPEPNKSKTPPSAKNPPKPMEPIANPTPKPKNVADLAKSTGKTPSTPEDMRLLQSDSGFWPNLPPRHRDQIDAHLRERFIRNYNEILREYYRALAESSPAEKRQ
ncbi:MAG: hypothetical protein EXR98_01850 [Gemmataceae bacterium]|nr:hypothetical protein [Gemmataceae bacterium]